MKMRFIIIAAILALSPCVYANDLMSNIENNTSEINLYGWDYPNGLAIINPYSASYSIILNSNRQFEAMAFDSVNKILYAIENLSGDNLLVRIDYENGFILDVGYVFGFTEITSMTFDVQSNNLYAIDQTTRTLLQIDPQTGIGTPVTNYTVGTSNALAAHPLTGELYLGWGVDPSYLTIIDKTTGALSIIGSLGINSVTGFVFDPITTELYGTGEFYAGGRQLFTVNVADASIVPVGPVGQVLSLAFTETAYDITIDSIITFFDESVADGTIYGSGKKLHIANLKLWLFRQTLETAKYFIEKEEIEYACKSLNRAFLRCDSNPRPIDFIEGMAVAELADMILEIMDELGCE